MSASSGKSSSKPVDMTPQAFKALQGPFANVISGLLGNIGGSNLGNDITNGYQGNTVAPITGNENSQLQQLQNYATGGNQSQTAPVTGAPTAGQSALNDSLVNAGANVNQTTANLMGANQNPTSGQTSSGFLGDLNNASGGVFSTDAANNPFLQAAIQAAQRPTQQALEETLGRTLPGRFAMAGQKTQPGGSSAFDRAAAIATRGSADALGDIATKISYQNYGDAANRAAGALGQFTTGQQNANLQTQQIGANTQQNTVDNALKASELQGNQAAQQSQIRGQEVDTMVKNLQAQALPRLIQDLGIERGMEVFNNKINSLLSGLGIAAGTTQPVIANSSSSKQASVGLK